jgi:hypothetical protein
MVSHVHIIHNYILYAKICGFNLFFLNTIDNRFDFFKILKFKDKNICVSTAYNNSNNCNEIITPKTWEQNN